MPGVMNDQTAITAAGPQEHVSVKGRNGSRNGRRITANSFRTLTARLKTAAATAIEVAPPQQEEWFIPPADQIVVPAEFAPPQQPPVEPQVSAAVPPAAVVEPQWPDLPALPDFGLPEFAPLEPFRPEPAEISATEFVDATPFAPEALQQAASPPPLEEPQVLWESAPERPEELPVTISAVLDADNSVSGGETLAQEPPQLADTGAQFPWTSPTPEAVVTSHSPEPVAESAVPAPSETTIKPSWEPPQAATAPVPKSASPLVEKVVDAALKTVTDSIFAKPSTAERAAFLREMAAAAEPQLDELAAAQPAIVAAVPAAEPVPAPAVTEEAPLTETLADRLGPSAALLRKPADAPDPFSKTLSDVIRLDPKPLETVNADESSGELALSLLDMMSAGSASGLPQERALAADTLLRMISRVPVKQLIAVVERMAIMESPPSLLVAKLIRDSRAEVVAPLVERCMHITDQDLMTAAAEGDIAKRRMIARRRILSPVMADFLIAEGDPSVLLTLIRNPGAAFSHEAFFRLAEHAGSHHGLLAPLCTRADLPAPVAFELFWFVPPELRRFIFSRFLTDSETLNKILKIARATQEGGELKFPNREVLEEAIDKVVDGKVEDAAQLLAAAAGISQDTTLRILSDRDGEPLTVILKALGYPRGKFEASMEKLKNSEFHLLNTGRNVSELQSIFDMLSFNKARILLTYWDWFVLKSGPYAPHN